jgi:hypothetical protein
MDYHVICKRVNGRPKHLSGPNRNDLYESGYWDIDPNDAAKVTDLYLHETKKEKSYFGGKVMGFWVANKTSKHAKRIIFQVLSTKEHKDVAWAGANHNRAWNGGLVG